MAVLVINNVTKRKLSTFPELQISNKVINTEAKLYVHACKKGYVSAKELLKIFYDNRTESMNDKIYVISKLLSLKEQLKMDELVFPNSLVAIDNVVSGYAMPWIKDNFNMYLFLQNVNVKNEIKIKYLKEIYNILVKLEKRQKGFDNKFYLGDIHEANFVFDIDTQSIKVVDLDSGYFSGLSAPVSKFLASNKCIRDLPNSFQFDEKTSMPIPNMNTTYLSFVYMFLNSISMDKSYRWNYETYYSYLDYLDKLRVNPVLLQELSSIYSNNPNLSFNIDIFNDFDCDKDYTLKRV